MPHRFSQALLALHALGPHSPFVGGSPMENTFGMGFKSWMIRKRHFGRIWLKPQAPWTAPVSEESSAPPVEVDLVATSMQSPATVATTVAPGETQKSLPPSLPSRTHKLHPFRGQLKRPLLPRSLGSSPAAEPPQKRHCSKRKWRMRLFMA